MGINNNLKKYTLVAFVSVAISIIVYVIFSYPQAGVADQGDFDRVMSVSGLRVMDSDVRNPNFKRFFDYIVTDYKTLNITPSSFKVAVESTSIGFLIEIIKMVCNLFGEDTFKTSYLAVVYGIIYVFSLYIIIKYLNIRSNLKLIFITIVILFVLFDGNYLVWFNSLYGEPMMITSLMLFISSCIYYSYEYCIIESEKNVVLRMFFVFIAALLFVGSKMQVITALPLVIFILGKVLLESRRLIKRSQFICFCVFFCFIAIYPIRISLANKLICKDTQYNSVFYGVLNGSENPRQDLKDMGLNPDMAVEAGKHSYLDRSEYVKYVPRTEITEKEFYSKMGNGKLVKFYLTHPKRFLQGMEYSATHSFSTGTSLGKHERRYSEEPVREFYRFTLWSDFRDKVFPKKLWFIAAIYTAVIIASIIYYIRNRGLSHVKAEMQLLWIIILIGLIQFPMPSVGNGQADTTKQLYLFNFTFDLIVVVSLWWCFCKTLKLFEKIKNSYF